MVNGFGINGVCQKNLYGGKEETNMTNEERVEDILDVNAEAEAPLSVEELEAMLKELEQEIGLEEMNRRLTTAMESYAEANPQSTAEKILVIQKGNLEDMLMPEDKADFTDAKNVADLLHAYYQNEGEDTFAAVIMEIGWCMMNDGAVLVPTVQHEGRVDMPLLDDEESGQWIAVYTSAEHAKAWPDDAEMRPAALEMMVLLATAKTGFTGIVINPGTAEPMPLEREILEQMERACNDTRKEEARLAEEEKNNAEGAAE